MPDDNRSPNRPVMRLGVAACLLGEEVRFNGGHKRDRYVTGGLAEVAELVPLCPEVKIGLGVPREAIRLAQDANGDVRLVGSNSGADHTDAMRTFSEGKAAEIVGMSLSGYIFQTGSPSCGMERVKQYDRNGVPSKVGVGLFAAAVMAAMPLLPCEEEGRLNDDGLRENFLVRIFAYTRLRAHFSGAWTRGSLVAFHTAEKHLLLAHHQPTYRQLGRLVAGGKSLPREELAARYQHLYMTALKHHARRGAHVNVMQHQVGYVSGELDAGDRAEVHDLIDQYRQGLVPLSVPMTLIQHHVRRLGKDYLQGQSYQSPYPKGMDRKRPR